MKQVLTATRVHGY